VDYKMAYTKTNWVDRSVQYPNRFTQAVNGSLVTLNPSPGTVTQAGTPITATALNNLETQYEKAVADCVKKSGDTMSGNLDVLGRTTTNTLKVTSGDLLVAADPNGGVAFSSERMVFSVGNNQGFVLDDLFGANGINSGDVRLLFHTGDPTFRMEHHSGSGATLVVQTVSNTSDRELKKNIVDYDKSALEEINTTPIRHYNFNEDVDGVDIPRVGIIMQEAPLEVVDSRGNGVDPYAMVSMAWKAIQELSAENKSLKEEILQIKSHIGLA
jgi:hypothetical protein